MQRVTISLDDELLAELDRFASERGYAGRSEALRDLVRSGLQQVAADRVGGEECVAALVYAYDHRARELAGRLTRGFHDHHDIALSTLHVHLDHDNCLEVVVLRGPTGRVGDFATQVAAERGVIYGRLVMMPAHVADEKHPHGDTAAHPHAHTRIRK